MFLLSLLVLIFAISVLWIIPIRRIYKYYAELHGLRSFEIGGWIFPMILLSVFLAGLIIEQSQGRGFIDNQSKQYSAILSGSTNDILEISQNKLVEMNHFSNIEVSFNNIVYKKIILFSILGILGIVLLLYLHYGFERRIGLWSRAAIRRKGRFFLRSNNTSYVSSVRLKVVEGQLVRVIAARTAVIRFCK